MATEFTAIGNHDFDGTPKSRIAITTQGVAGNDFTWEMQYSLDEGTTWTSYKDTNDASVFTGSQFKVMLVGTRKNRFKLTSLGAATKVMVDIF